MLRRHPSRLFIAPILAASGTALAQDCRWVELAVSSPSPRSWPAAAYDEQRHRLVVVGGFGGTGQDLRETWEWDGAIWTLVSTIGPSGRESAVMAYDAARGKTVLFGGQASGGYPSDTWEWDGITWVLAGPETGNPAGRVGHLLAYDPIRAKTVLFGGYTNSTDFATTHEWDGVSWVLRATTAPSSITRGSGAFNPARGRVILAGWHPYPNFATRTLEWDGTAWSELATTSANGLRDRTFLDTARGVVVHINWPHSVAEWNGTAWVPNGTYGPDSAAIVGYDSQLARGMALGTTLNPLVQASWLWNPVATREYLVITQLPTDTNADLGTSATLHIAANNAEPLNYQWFKGAVAVQDDGRIVGAHTNALTITAIVESDYARYTVTVSDACNGPVSAAAHLYPVGAPWSGTCYANCDNSTVFPFLNANDFQCFLEVYAAGDSRANCDGSTASPLLNANDFQCFLNAFAAGCSAP